MKPMRFGMVGCGFWGRVQLAGWGEHADRAVCVAVCDRDLNKARALAGRNGVPAVYDDPTAMFEREGLDFVDLVTSVETHAPLTRLAVEHRTPVICQKPLADSLDAARGLVKDCEAAGVPLLVHENFRWQRPLREAHAVLRSGELGRVFRGTIDFISGFPVFDNQPFLKMLDRFILTDLGSHTLDVARFLFGEAETVACLTDRVHPDIQGEDVATVMLQMRSGSTVLVRMAYAGNRLERECFPQTLLFIEGESGTLELTPGYELRVTTAAGTRVHAVPPPEYPWVDPRYAVVQASVVPCQTDLLRGLRGDRAETTGTDNLRTVELVWAAYAAADSGRVVRVASEPAEPRGD